MTGTSTAEKGMRDPLRLIRHNHWLALRLGGHEIQVCARCSGTVAGYFLSQLGRAVILSVGFSSVPLHWQVALAYVLAAPSGIDWLTQTWGFRLSTNRIRFLTGLLIGIGAGLLTLSSLGTPTKIMVLASSSVAVISAGYMGRGIAGAIGVSRDKILCRC